MYFCRITLPFETIRPAFEVIRDEVSHLVVYEHLTDNEVKQTHCHFYIFCPYSTDTLKNRFKECIPSKTKKGNSFWSFKTEYKPYGSDKTIPVDRNCITYMSKGKLDPSMMKGFTQDEIDGYKSGWVEQPVKRSYQTKLQYIVKETPCQAKKRKNDLIDEMVAEIGEIVNPEFIPTERIVRCIIKILNDNHVVFSRYTIRDYYDTICARKFTEKFVDQLINYVGYRT